MTSATAPVPEFSRVVDIRQADGRTLSVEADETERAALAVRLGIVAVERLAAGLTIDRDGDSVTVEGTIDAKVVQSCAVSAEDLQVTIADPLAVRFVLSRAYRPDEELELDAADLDEIEFDGSTFDLGEAVAQTLALAIDPFMTGPAAEETRRRVGLGGEAANGAFAVLAKLKK